MSVKTRGKGITKPEQDMIRLARQKGWKTKQIADLLGRSPRSIRKQVAQMRDSGNLSQEIADLGQLERGADE